jgi:probable rRNA maturation factor
MLSDPIDTLAPLTQGGWQWVHAHVDDDDVDTPTAPPDNKAMVLAQALPEGEAAFIAAVLPAWATAWLALLAQQPALLAPLGLQALKQPTLCQVEWLCCTEPQMAELNREHRQQAKPTDVLTFPLWQAPIPTALLADAPLLPLGSVVLCLPYALGLPQVADVVAQGDSAAIRQMLLSYALERLTHGHLHLLGQHHATQTAYNQVVGYQGTVLAALGLTSVGAS